LDSVSLSGVARRPSCLRPAPARGRWPGARRRARGGRHAFGEAAAEFVEVAALRHQRLRASSGRLAACSPLGISSTAPAFRRLTLPSTKASGLARSSATSIWSSEMLAGLLAPAILPAVSPAAR
jgi:hypothetical protein